MEASTAGGDAALQNAFFDTQISQFLPLFFFGRNLVSRQAAVTPRSEAKQTHEEIRHEKRNET
jgi:hypothetical protein